MFGSAAHADAPLPSQPGKPALNDGAIWFLLNTDPGKSTLATDGALRTVTITAVDKESWHVQLNRLARDVQEGKPYVIRFRAKADIPRGMVLSGLIANGDYHGIITSQYVGLDTDWKPYTFTLTPHDIGGHPVYFPQFVLGDKTGTVWIDNLMVLPFASASDPAAPIVSAPREGELRAEGAVQATGFGRDSFTLLVSRLVRPDGTATSLSPARPKLVRLTADTEFRSLTDGSQLYLATLKPGDAVSVVGPDLGIGKPLPARLMLR